MHDNDLEGHLTYILGDNRLPQRVWDKIRVFRPTGCWEWTACISPKGYGQLTFQGKNWQAHRLVFTELVRDIPDGLVLDHLCDNRCCVNPGHFDVVTSQHNTFCGWSASAMQQRFPWCRLGHPFNAEDSTGRYCLQCRRKHKREDARKRRAQ